MSIFALLLAPVALQATPAEPVCIRAGDVPREFAGWYGAVAGRPQIGAPFMVTARPRPQLRLVKVADAAHPGGGAVASFLVTRAGTYRIALSEGAWVDVVRGRRSAESVAHAHGPICTGMRKIVDFRLTRGAYQLQLSELKAASVKVMIVPAPRVRMIPAR